MRFYSITRADKRFFSAAFIIAFQLLSLQLQAQSETFSPYSRYGIGDIPFNGFIKNIGMGGTGIGMRPYFNLNVSNPASYSSLLFTTFEIGASTSFAKMQTTSLSQRKSETAFSYFALGFPVVYQKWGATLGLIPFSNVGYKIVSPITGANNTNVINTYEGTGGVNRFFIGNAVTIKKKLSIGVNASYLFGTLDRIHTEDFGGNYFYNTRYTYSTIIRDFYFDSGLQYTFDSLKFERSDSLKFYDNIKKTLGDSIHVLTMTADSISKGKNKDAPEIKLQMEVIQKNISELNARMAEADSARRYVTKRRQKSNWSLTFGFTGSLPTNISASQDSLEELYQSSGSFVIIKDTILNTEGRKGVIKFPLTVGFGFTLKKGTRWLISADALLQNWKDYSFLGTKDSLRNSMRISLGAQYTPDERGPKSYWQTMQYRLGSFYNQTYLQLKGSKLNEYGVTAGLGFPIRKGFSMIQLSTMLGTRGTTDNNLIKENFVRVSIGVTFIDRWFIKPKFD